MFNSWYASIIKYAAVLTYLLLIISKWSIKY